MKDGDVSGETFPVERGRMLMPLQQAWMRTHLEYSFNSSFIREMNLKKCKRLGLTILRGRESLFHERALKELRILAEQKQRRDKIGVFKYIRMVKPETGRNCLS